MTAKVVIGQGVYSSDGHHLGDVKDVGDKQFKLDVARHPDFWLGLDSVADVSDDRVTVSFTAGRVGEFIAEPRPSMTGNR